MTKLMVVSNRVADINNAASSGGMAVALAAALTQQRGVWLGWDGTVANNGTPGPIRIAERGTVTYALLSLSTQEYDTYYLGFSNRILWPAFHYRLDLGEFKPEYFEGYRKVNARFAREVCNLLDADDLIWVHDYHLIPIASALRALGVKNRIGFFLHIPFPPPEIFTAVPEYDWLAKCLLSYDVIGLQTPTDNANLLRYFAESGRAEVLSEDLVRTDGRIIVVKPFPIGIDATSIHALAHSTQADEKIERLQRRSMASTFVIGVDRLDYTKGIPERLRAFRRLLEQHPELMKAVTLMQVAPPTREAVAAYVDIRGQLEGLSGAINGEFADFDWTPVRYVHRTLPQATLAALFRGCRVGLITPLRDGMNLVAKEYVAAQDDDDPGVLVLSKFAGAAEQLKDSVIVNPYDIEEVADALFRAVTMPREERVRRHRGLAETVRAHSVDEWRDNYLSALRASQLFPRG